MLIYDVQNLVKVYPGHAKPVNDHINLQIHQGEIFGILGDNGAGKSTLVRQIVNLLPSSAGMIAFLGKPIATIPQMVQLNVGYMPQESGAVKNLTIAEGLYFTAHLRGLNRRAARQECASTRASATTRIFNPATYAASALKQTLLESLTQRIIVDTIALAGFSCLTFWFVSRKLM